MPSSSPDNIPPGNQLTVNPNTGAATLSVASASASATASVPPTIARGRDLLGKESVLRFRDGDTLIYDSDTGSRQ